MADKPKLPHPAPPVHPLKLLLLGRAAEKSGLKHLHMDSVRLGRKLQEVARQMPMRPFSNKPR